jgi:hypothetical protein
MNRNMRATIRRSATTYGVRNSISDTLPVRPELIRMNPFAVYTHIQTEKTISPAQMQSAVSAARNAYNATYGSMIGNMDNTSVTTTQGGGTPCGGSTGNPCK